MALLLFGLGLGVAWRQQVANDKRTARELDILADTAGCQIVHRLEIYTRGLEGVRATVLAAGRSGINSQVFRQYYDSAASDREFAGVRGFGFIRRISGVDETVFIAAAPGERASDGA